jgi:peroxiredoxin (alkyl hydroperoxide reductase subunit C)
MAINVGEQAPDFELRDQSGEAVRLSDYRGKKAVVIVFYPLAFSGICTKEMCNIRDSLTAFHGDEVETLSISVDSPHVHRVWAQQENFEFPMLADFWPHGAVAQQYGVFNEGAGLAERGTFIIDKDGTVIYAEHNGVPEERDQQAWRDALAAIGLGEE